MVIAGALTWPSKTKVFRALPVVVNAVVSATPLWKVTAATPFSAMSSALSVPSTVKVVPSSRMRCFTFTEPSKRMFVAPTMRSVPSCATEPIAPLMTTSPAALRISVSSSAAGGAVEVEVDIDRAGEAR